MKLLIIVYRLMASEIKSLDGTFHTKPEMTKGRHRHMGVWSIIFYLLAISTCCYGQIDNFTTELPSVAQVTSDKENPFNFSNVGYSKPVLNESYRSQNNFNAKGMQPLYDIADLFIALVMPAEPLPPDSVFLNGTNLQIYSVTPHQWHDLAMHYIGFLIVISIGLLFCLIMPIAGLLFCCCRCCSDNKVTYEKKSDSCRRLSLGIGLTVLVVAILFGVVCAFVTNEYLEESVLTLPSTMQTSLDDVDLYLKNVNVEINNTLLTNYEEMSIAVNKILDSSGTIVVEALNQISNATALKGLWMIVSNLSKTEEILIEINNVTMQVQNITTNLNNSLLLIQNNLTSMLSQCNSIQACKQMLSYVDQHGIQMNGDLDQLPDVTSAINDIVNVLSNGIVKGVKKGQLQLKNMERQISIEVEGQVQKVKSSMQSASFKLVNISSNITSVFESTDTDFQKGQEAIENLNNVLKLISPIRHYVLLGVSIFLLIILFCFVIGLFCGCCGKAPDSIYGDECCNRGAGATFLMAAVGLIFVSSTVLMILTTIQYIVGSVAESAICWQLESPNPNQTQLFDLLDNGIDQFLQGRHTASGIDLSQLNVNMGNVLSRCNQNESIYEVFDMDRVYNLSALTNYSEEYNIDNYIQQISQVITGQYTSSITLLSNETIKELEQLADSSVAQINFTLYDVMYEKLLLLNITELAVLVNVTADRIKEQSQGNPDLQKVINQLEAISYELVLLRPEVIELHRLVLSLFSLSKELSRLLLVYNNQTNFSEAIHFLINQTVIAEEFLRTNGVVILQQIAEKYANTTLQLLNSYVNYSYNYIRYEAGQCGPLSNAFNATVTAGCKAVLNPVNGFWLSVGWCLILFLPCMAFAVSLVKLYRKNEPYSAAADSEYLYDAYADRDNIPLANVNGKKGRLYSDHHGSYENHNGYVSSPSLPPSPTPLRGGLRNAHGDRYRDMAPKNWDTPSALPPHFGGTPLLPSGEYERPPPYYYPGPGKSK